MALSATTTRPHSLSEDDKNRPRTQGEKITICVQPELAGRVEAVFMRSIEEFE